MPDLTPGGDGGPDEPTTGMPRWVKVFGIVAAILAVLVVAVLLVSGGEHGPGRHMSSGEGASGVGVAADRLSLPGVHG